MLRAINMVYILSGESRLSLLHGCYGTD